MLASSYSKLSSSSLDALLSDFDLEPQDRNAIISKLSPQDAYKALQYAASIPSLTSADRMALLFKLTPELAYLAFKSVSGLSATEMASLSLRALRAPQLSGSDRGALQAALRNAVEQSFLALNGGEVSSSRERSELKKILIGSDLAVYAYLAIRNLSDNSPDELRSFRAILLSRATSELAARALVELPELSSSDRDILIQKLVRNDALRVAKDSKLISEDQRVRIRKLTGEAYGAETNQ